MPSAIILSPFPFPDIEATTKVKIVQEVDTPYDGPQETVLYDGNAVYDEKAKTVFNAESKQISLNGMLIIKGDVQSLDAKVAFQGYVKIGEESKRIYSVRKPKVLGVIFSTEVDLQ